MYHVTLGGQGYLLDLATYVRRAHAPFAPKRAQGTRSLGDFVAEEGLRISDWSGGEGAVQLDPARPERWRSGTGIDVYSEPGSLRLGPELTAAFTSGSLAEWTAAAVFKGSLYLGLNDGQIIKWTGSAATSVTAIPGGKAVGALAVFTNKLYASNKVDGAVSESVDGTAWTHARFTVAGAVGVRVLATFYRQTAQYLYVAAKGTGPGGVGSVYWWDGAALSAKQYDFEEEEPRLGLVLSNRLYFFVADSASRRCGIYSVDDSGSGGVYRHHEVVPGNYVAGGAVHNGLAYLGSGRDGVVWSWDGSKLVELKRLSSAVSSYTTELSALAGWGGAVWVGYVEGAGGLGLLRYDGASWSRPVAGLASDEPRFLIPFLGVLYLGTYRAATAAPTFRGSGRFGGSGTLESGLFDAGLPSIDKVLRSATVVHSALASGQSVQLQYRLEDTGAWMTLGTSSTPGATTATFAFSGTVTCKQVAFRLVLAGSAGATSSPVVYDVLFRYALAPGLKREWELAVLLEGTAELPLVRLDGSPEPLTGTQLAAALWTLKSQPGPTTFVDLDGSSRQVWITELREEVAARSQRRGYQTIGRLRLLEA